MEAWGVVLTLVDGVARETLLFAAVGFLIGGIDDALIDLLYGLRRWAIALDLLDDSAPRSLPADLPSADEPMAIFVPAWDEHAVIGAMLRHSLATHDYPDYRIFVGTYPNDAATIAAVADVAADDPRVRLVIGLRDGPTTKADCLNTLWRAMQRDEESRGQRYRAVVLHDAEDVVDAAELTIFAALIGRYATVQLPVLPLVDRGSRLVAGHYADEFAEAHAKQLVVRQTLGAGLPLAGVGCAIDRDMLDLVAAQRGCPFDADSLTEDYELGLRIAQLGGRGTLARIRMRGGGPVALVRAYFPATLDAAVRQKARWMTGIALAGWDRIGWARWQALGDHWMRMRDRRAPLAVLVLSAAYLALVAGALSAGLHAVLGGQRVGAGSVPGWLLVVNAGLLIWRLAMRALFTGAAYGWAEALWSIPRMVVGNVIALLAARRAMIDYVAMLRGRPPRWDKTAHVFPDLASQSGTWETES